jgi:hypothetical protein
MRTGIDCLLLATRGEYERVGILCPPGSGFDTLVASAKFHARGDYSAESSVKCDLVDDANPGTLIQPGVVTTVANPMIPMTGTWTAEFTSVPITVDPARDRIVAEGLSTHSGAFIRKIKVVMGGPDPCPSLRFSQTGPEQGVHGGVAIRAMGFRAAQPIESDGAPMPVSIAGMTRAAFTVGGPLSARSKTIRVTLDSRPAEVAYEEGGWRWSASFTNVPAGEYTLRAVADDKSAASVTFIIRAELPQ